MAVTKTYFILNKHGHYFIVNGGINVSQLEQCDLFDSLPDLLDAAAEISNLQLDEVEGNEYMFKYDAENKEWIEVDTSGSASQLITEQTIEQYLSDWSL